jgi:hypothetical protein
VHVGVCDAATYAIAKKKTSFEFLREKMHLRPRTNTISAVARIRNALAFATHRFFQENGFLYVHTPIITASDCEGAGEMFQVRVCVCVCVVCVCVRGGMTGPDASTAHSSTTCRLSHSLLLGPFLHQITTLLSKAEKEGDRPPPISPEKIDELKAKVSAQAEIVKAAKEVRLPGSPTHSGWGV